MIQAVSGRALRGRRASAVLGRVIGGVVGLDAGALELASFLRLHGAGVLGLFALLAPAARPAALQGGEERVGALRHRRAVIPMMPMMMMTMVDHAGLARIVAPPRRRAVGGPAAPQLRRALRQLTTPVQVQPGSLLRAGVVTCRSKESRSRYPYSSRRVIESPNRVLLRSRNEAWPAVMIKGTSEATDSPHE